MVAARFCNRRIVARFGRDRAARDALADTPKAARGMKILAALQAAPICAAPVQTEAVAFVGVGKLWIRTSFSRSDEVAETAAQP